MVDRVVGFDPRGAFSLPEKEASFTENFSAGFGYTMAPIVARAEEEIRFADVPRETDFDPFMSVGEGYDGFEDSIVRAKNLEHLEFIKQSIDENKKRRDVIAKADFISGALLGGMFTPTNLASVPLFGQIGFAAISSMTMRAAAIASAKGGAAIAVADEIIRAPFDPLNTATESGINMLTTTAFTTVLGAAPSAFLNVKGTYNKAAAKLNNLQRGEIGEEIDGTKVSYTDDNVAAPVVSTKGNTIVVNEARIDKEFNSAPWVEEYDLPLGAFSEEGEYKNFLIQRSNLAKTLERKPKEKEKAYDKRLTVEATLRTYNGYGLKKTPFSNSIFFKMIPTPGKTILLDPEVPEFIKRAYISHEGMGAMALERNIAGKGVQSIRQTLPVYSAMASTLMKRGREHYGKQMFNNETLPEVSGLLLSKGDKRRMVGMKGSSDKWIEETIDLYVEGSDPTRQADVLNRATPEQQAFFEDIRLFNKNLLIQAQDVGLLRDVKDINTLLSKRQTELEKLNLEQAELDLENLAKGEPREPARAVEGVKIVVGKGVGRTTEDGRYVMASYNKKEKVISLDKEAIYDSFKQKPWENPKVDGVDPLDGSLFQTPEDWFQFVKSHEIHHTIYSAESLGFKLPGDKAAYENAINNFAMKDLQETYFVGSRDPNFVKLQTEADIRFNKINEIEKEIEYYKGYTEYAGSRNKFVLPIYYDKAKLSTDPQARQELTDIFEDHIAKETHYWDNKKEEWVQKPLGYDHKEAAERIMHRIMEEEPEDLYMGSTSPRGSKHLNHRALDIPEHLVKDYIIKNQALFYTYAEKMGRKIEYTRHFGNEGIESILDKGEKLMRSQGASEKKIKNVRVALLAEHQRVMGRFVENPDSLTNQVVRGIKEAAGLTYLHGAGFSAIAETGMMVMERGIGKTIEPLVDREVRSILAKNAKDLDETVEQAGLANNMVQDRYINDSIRGIQPNAVEKVFNPITSAFYNIPIVGNNLGTMTRYTRIVDGTFRSSDHLRIAHNIKKNTATPEEIEYLARHGIGEADARRMADLEGVWETNPSQTAYYANRSAWPSETRLDRDLARKWDTSITTGMGNTVVHATSFDKPMMVDGATFVKWYPWMETAMGLKKDKLASTATIPMTKIETGAMGLPFQFMAFGLGATSRITAQLFDPARQFRMQGLAALLAMSYVSLSIKKPDWWFESKTNAELTAKIIDHSGATGILFDVYYHGLHGSIAGGLVSEDNPILRPRYDIEGFGDVGFDILGAAPGQIRELIGAGIDYSEGYPREALKNAQYNVPLAQLPLLQFLKSLTDDMDYFAPDRFTK